MFQVAKNSYFDLCRKRTGTPELLIIDDDENPLETIDEKTAYIYVEAGLDIASALLRIKAAYRTVLILHLIEGFTYEEISEMLAIPLGTVKTYVHRAKLALRKELIHYGSD